MDEHCVICGRPLSEAGPYVDSAPLMWGEDTVHEGCPHWYRDNVVNYVVQLGRLVLAEQALGLDFSSSAEQYGMVHEAIRSSIDIRELAGLLGPAFVRRLPEFETSI